MYIYMTFAILPFVAHIVSCEIIEEPAKDLKQAKTTLKPTTGQAPTMPTSEVPSIPLKQGSLLDKTPMPRISNQPEEWGANIRRYEMLLNNPHSLTKLAKTLSLGFDPSYNKDYFEPFERRPKPVTLVSFRKKGYAARHTVKQYSASSNEVAEQQSPFNEVSYFWQNDDNEA